MWVRVGRWKTGSPKIKKVDVYFGFPMESK